MKNKKTILLTFPAEVKMQQYYSAIQQRNRVYVQHLDDHRFSNFFHFASIRVEVPFKQMNQLKSLKSARTFSTTSTSFKTIQPKWKT